MPRLVVISDTHNYHDEIKMPEGDILVHCGDATVMGSIQEITDFTKWWRKQDFEHKFFVAGNHDINWDLYRRAWANSMVENMHGKAQEIMGLKFYGMSWSVLYGQWAFMLPERELANQWSNISNDTDVLVTHGPPYGLLDANKQGNSCGSPSLREKVMEIKPKLHCFGHIHESYGHFEHNGIEFVNAAICDAAYDPRHAPMVIDL